MRAMRAGAALLLLVSIAADLASDPRCHPPGTLEATASVSSAETADDPCSDGCVPDCYCCSVLSPTSIFRLTDADQSFVVLAAPLEPAGAPGVAAALYRPPLAFL
jgi:hypothetical protein